MTLVATTAEQPFTVAKIPVSAWSFAIRVWLATVLALLVSFWLQLESPTTAALTVAILAEPTRGQALDKAAFSIARHCCERDSINRNHRALLPGERSDPRCICGVDWYLRLCGEPFGRLSGLCRGAVRLHRRNHCDTADRYPAARV